MATIGGDEAQNSRVPSVNSYGNDIISLRNSMNGDGKHTSQRAGPHNPKYDEKDYLLGPDDNTSKLVVALRDDPSVGFIDMDSLKLVKKVGKGATGQVWEGVWDDTTRVAIKTLMERSKSRMKEKDARSLIKEIKLLSSVQHNNIIRCFGASAQAETVYLVMEFAPGGSLGQLLDKKNKLPREAIVQIAYQTASGLSYLHSPKISIIHRDLKPDNLLFGANNEIKIADFGSAKLERNTKRFTLNPGFTPIYTAPEMGREFSEDGVQPDYGFAVDVYSFGVILYQMITGKEPFEGRQFLEVFVAMVNNNLKLLDEFVIPDEFPELGELTQSCIDPDPNVRMTSKAIALSLQEDYKQAKSFVIEL